MIILVLFVFYTLSINECHGLIEGHQYRLNFTQDEVNFLEKIVSLKDPDHYKKVREFCLVI